MHQPPSHSSDPPLDSLILYDVRYLLVVADRLMRTTTMTTRTAFGSDVIEIPASISVDDHVVEPPTLWTDRLPRKFRERGPRVERIKGVVTGASRGRLPPGHRGSPRARRAVGRPVGLRGLRGAIPSGMMQVHQLRDILFHSLVTYDDDPARLLRPERAPRRHGSQPLRGEPLVPDGPPLLRSDVPRGQRTRTSRCCASGRTTTGCSTTGAPVPATVV